MANPTQPQGQRERFEAAYRAMYPLTCLHNPEKFSRDPSGCYYDTTALVAWRLFQAAEAGQQELGEALLKVARLVLAARTAPNEWNLDAFDAAADAAESVVSAYKARAEGVGGVVACPAAADMGGNWCGDRSQCLEHCAPDGVQEGGK